MMAWRLGMRHHGPGPARNGWAFCFNGVSHQQTSQESSMHLVNRAFRLNSATMGIRGKGSNAMPVVIPAGSTITVTNYDAGPFRECLWGETTVLVLKTDIE